MHSTSSPRACLAEQGSLPGMALPPRGHQAASGTILGGHDLVLLLALWGWGMPGLLLHALQGLDGPRHKRTQPNAQEL